MQALTLALSLQCFRWLYINYKYVHICRIPANRCGNSAYSVIKLKRGSASCVQKGTYLPYVPLHRLCSPTAPMVQSYSVLLNGLCSGIKNILKTLKLDLTYSN